MKKSSKGFTLLEVMMAIAIFGILMGLVSQFVRAEIAVYKQASAQSAIEQKARTAMMHVLDQIRLNRFTYYVENPNNGGVYILEPGGEPACIINVNPDENAFSGNLPVPPSGTIIYDRPNGELLYLDPQTHDVFLIADQITLFSLSPSPDDYRLLRIYLEASDSSGNMAYNLLTWVRLY